MTEDEAKDRLKKLQENAAKFLSVKPFTYSYWNGQRMVSEESTVLCERIKPEFLAYQIDDRVSKAKWVEDAPKAHQSILRRIRKIFNVSPFDEGGLTEMETLGLMNHFLTAVKEGQRG